MFPFNKSVWITDKQNINPFWAYLDAHDYLINRPWFSVLVGGSTFFLSFFSFLVGMFDAPAEELIFFFFFAKVRSKELKF